jgi:hypothetical protein
MERPMLASSIAGQMCPLSMHREGHDTIPEICLMKMHKLNMNSGRIIRKALTDIQPTK